MKKQYSKPVISFENFAFSSNIAGACASLIGLFSQGNTCRYYGTYSDPINGSCEFMDNTYAIFLSSNSDCMTGPQEDDPDSLCYHVSTSETRMFAS